MPAAGAEASVTVELDNVKAVPGFCTTPFKESNICCTLAGALDRVNCVLLPSNASLNVEIKKLPIDCTSSHAVLVPFYTSILPVLVLKNKSPLSRELVGFDEPTLYLSLKSFISPLRLTRSLSARVALW